MEFYVTQENQNSMAWVRAEIGGPDSSYEIISRADIPKVQNICVFVPRQG
jgi:hypothetical protein